MAVIAAISERGNLTIPKKIRKNFTAKNFRISVNEQKNIVLEPIVIVPEFLVHKKEINDIENFSSLAESSFSFWEGSNDDIYSRCNAI